MNLTTAQAIDRLRLQFPLLERRAGLSATLQRAHRALLKAILHDAQPLGEERLASCLQTDDWAPAVSELAQHDLIVVDAKRQVVGAYPFSTVPTAHQLEFGNISLYAMCALDALSVGPLLREPVWIRSRCHVTGRAIEIRQDTQELVDVEPGEDVRLGIRWQVPRGPAAHSMCREMVFLRDAPTALRWQHRDVASISIFPLQQGIAIGKGFFAGLLESTQSDPRLRDPH